MPDRAVQAAAEALHQPCLDTWAAAEARDPWRSHYWDTRHGVDAHYETAQIAVQAATPHIRAAAFAEAAEAATEAEPSRHSSDTGYWDGRWDARTCIEDLSGAGEQA